MRTKFLGEEKLIKQAQTAFPKGITKIGDNVYFFLAYGGSTCTLVVGEKSCVLVDTLNGIAPAKEAYEEVRKITDKPIKHIIYTHQHTDHTSGAKVFAVDNPKIYGHKPVRPEYEYSHMLKDICRIRGMRQFGTICSDEERISVGVGPLTETPIGNNPAHLGQLPCTNTIEEDVVNLNLDGIDVTIVSAPGETDEQVFVYFPKYKVLCCGDNYYESWPNLYAIRGSQYRDIASWVKALDDMVTYEAEVLLPGHTHAVIGKDSVRDTLTNYRDALKYVLTETLKGMNEGKTMDELVESVTLPEHLKNIPYLQEYYGTVAWSVRAIYTG